MITNYIMAPDRLLHDVHGVEKAVKPWNSVDAAALPHKKVHTCVPQEQINRCLECTAENCYGGKSCRYRQGVPKRKKEKISSDTNGGPRPPRGYDEDKLKKAMAHAYTDKELAKALGLSLYMTKRWLEWRYR